MAYYHHYKAPPARRGSSSSLSKGRGSTTLPGEPATEYEGHNKSSYPLYPANDIPSLQHTSTQDYMYSNIFKFGVKPPPPSQLHTTTITYKTPPQPKQAADYKITCMLQNFQVLRVNPPPNQWHTTTITRHYQQEEGIGSTSLSKGRGDTTLPGKAAAQYEVIL